MKKILLTTILMAAFYPCIGQIFISELFSASNSDIVLRNEKYVELHNPTDCSISLNGWAFYIITDCVTNIVTPLDGITIHANSTIRLNASNATLYGDVDIVNFEFVNNPSNMNFNWDGEYRDGAFLQNASGLPEDVVIPSNYGACTSPSVLFENFRLQRKSNICSGSTALDFSLTDWNLIPVNSIADLPLLPEHNNVCMPLSGSAEWLGTVNTDWHNCNNWSTGEVPNQFIDVVIGDNAFYDCEVYNSTARCKSIVMNKSTGSNSTMLRVRNDRILNIEESLNCNLTGGTGDIIIRFQDGTINMNGDFVCNLNSSNIQSNIDIEFIANSDNALFCNNIILQNNSSGFLVNNSILFNISVNSGEVHCNNLTLEGNGALINSILTTDIGASTTDITVENDVTLIDLAIIDIQSGSFRIGGDLINTSGVVNPLIGASTTSAFEFFGNDISQNIVSSTEVPFHVLIINNPNPSSGVALNADISIHSTLLLTDDYINLNGNRLTIENETPFAVFGTGGVVAESTDFGSSIRWKVGSTLGSYNFPFATSVGGQVIPFEFQLTQGSTDYVEVSTYGTGLTNLPLPPAVSDMVNLDISSNGASVVDRWWNIDAPNLGSLMANVSFTYTDAEHSVGCEACTNAKRHNGSTWENSFVDPTPIFTDIPGISRKLTVEGISTFSPWGIVGEPIVPLPVELLNFEARLYDQNRVDLFWTTFSEINSSEFVVERSKDGFDFREIGRVTAAGFSSNNIDYFLSDYDPENGINYYRLKSVDLDGSYSYSDIRSVRISNFYTLIPSENGFEIQSDHMLEVRLFDSRGRMILAEQGFAILLDQQSAGIYILQIKSGNELESKRIRY